MKMRPEQLKSPYTWAARKVLFKDRILFVPEHYDKLDEWRFPGWGSNELFGNNNPIHIEYCSGNGAWIANKALARPDINWVAVEKKFVRVRKIWSKIQNLDLKNLISIAGEGLKVTLHYFPHDSVSEVFINFPDPWPKKKHAKNRIIQPAFIAEVFRILKKGGVLTMVTDDVDYSNWMIAVMRGHTGFVSLHEPPFYVEELEDYGNSYFEELWREKGRSIRYHQFRKV